MGVAALFSRDALTLREQQVLDCYLQGLTAKDNPATRSISREPRGRLSSSPESPELVKDSDSERPNKKRTL
jgi:hypothetical protein